MLYHSTIDDDGYARWPDTYVGSEEYYAIDCGPYLTNENDTLDSVTWTLPTGLTQLDAQAVNNIAHVKIRTDSVGFYTVQFELNSIESGNTQKTLERIRLRVL